MIMMMSWMKLWLGHRCIDIISLFSSFWHCMIAFSMFVEWNWEFGDLVL